MPAGSQRLVERDRAGVYCPAGRPRCCNRKRAGGGGDGSGGNNLSGARRTAGEGGQLCCSPRPSETRGADACCQCSQQSPAPAPCFPAALESSPSVLSRVIRQPFPSPHPLLRCLSQWAAPADCRLYLLLNVHHCSVLHHVACETGVCFIFQRWKQRSHK